MSKPGMIVSQDAMVELVTALYKCKDGISEDAHIKLLDLLDSSAKLEPFKGILRRVDAIDGQFFLGDELK